MNSPANFQSFYLDITQKDIKEHIMGKMTRDGFVTFDMIRSPEELLHFCKRLGKIVMHRDAGQDGVTRIAQAEALSARSGYQAFTAEHLTLHTDGSSVPEPATFVVLWCARPAETGGVSLFVDGKRLYHCLAVHHPQILQALSTPGSALFAGAEPPLQSSIFSSIAEDKICIRFRYDNLVRYAPAVSKILPTLLELLDQYKIAFTLQEHQGYLLQNGRWLHGRSAFQGQREMYRILLHQNEGGSLGRYIHLGFDPD